MFIVGCPRSGTTWLYHVLLSSGDFAIYRTESQVYDRLAPAFGQLASDGKRQQFLSQWTETEFFLRSGLDVVDFSGKFLATVQSPGDFLRLFMNEICKLQGATYWAECTPDHALYIDRIASDFPDAVFLHALRDGRAVTASLARQSFIPTLTGGRFAAEVAAAAYWDWATQRVMRSAASAAGRVFTVRYEELVDNYEATLAGIGSAIGKKLDPNRIAANAIGSVTKPNSSFSSKPQGSRQNWSKHLNADALSLVEGVVGDTLLESGYDLVSDQQRRTWIKHLYTAKFELARSVKATRFATFFAGPTITNLTANDKSSEPTMRPSDHPDIIRRIVHGN